MNELIANILSVVVSVVIIPLLTWGTSELVKLIKVKYKKEKTANNIELLSLIITNSVRAVTQSFVEDLKKSERFDDEAKKAAFQKAKEIIITQLTDELKDFISMNFGDLDMWLRNQIEATINAIKNK